MGLYAIGDLHLSLSTDKPMDVFGKEWKDHVEKIEKNWKKQIHQEDTVVITGDHSWGRNLNESRADLGFIASLPGRKILLRGNHDMFWDAKKTRLLNELYKGKLSLSSSFGFHDKSYRTNTRKGFMTPVIFQALETAPGTAIYMTDCNKLFTTDKRGILKTDTRKYQEILQKEIELVKPSCIISHGRTANAILSKIVGSINCELHYVPYIGNSYMKKENREKAITDFVHAFKNKNNK